MTGTIVTGTWIIRRKPVYSWGVIDSGGAQRVQTGTLTYWERIA